MYQYSYLVEQIEVLLRTYGICIKHCMTLHVFTFACTCMCVSVSLMCVARGDGKLGCLCGKAGIICIPVICVMAPPIHLGAWSMAMAAF